MKRFRFIIIVCLLTSLPFIGFNQPDPTHNGNGSSVGNTPVGGGWTCCPIDGGLSVLLGLGLAYGASTARRIPRVKE